MKYFLPQKKSN